MALTTEERIEVILMSGERSFRVVAADFNNRHPERLPISDNTVVCLISKLRETGTVADKARSGLTKSATDETHCQPQSQFLGIWKLSTWQCCVKLEVFLGAVVKICSYDTETSFSRLQNDFNSLLRAKAIFSYLQQNVL